MVILFVGNGKEYLSAFAQDVAGVDTVIVTSVPLLELPAQFKSLAAELKLIIIDTNSPPSQLVKGIEGLRLAFPQAQIWSLYDASSRAMHKELRLLGFQRIISYQDDLSLLLTTSFG
jgi:hypothetical protein